MNTSGEVVYQVALLLLSGVNLVLVTRLSFFVGRWSGIVDTRLNHLEEEGGK